MQQNKVFVGAAVVVLSVFAGFIGGGFNASTDTITREVVRELQPIVETALGSASSPSVVNGCMQIEGTQACFYSSKMSNSSTTCAFKTPAATTTLPIGGFVAQFVNPTGAMQVEMGVGPNGSGQQATTTLIATLSATANGRRNHLVSTTTASIAPNELTDFIVPPNQYLSVRVGSSSPTLTGTCRAVLFAY